LGETITVCLTGQVGQLKSTFSEKGQLKGQLISRKKEKKSGKWREILSSYLLHDINVMKSG